MKYRHPIISHPLSPLSPSFLCLRTRKYLGPRKRSHDDSLQLERGKKGIWHYQPQGGGAPLEVFTYVRKNLYSWDKYGKKLSIAAGLLYFGILVRGWYRKKRNALGALRGGSGKAPSQESKGAEASDRLKGATHKTP